jgi:hypothetical protein
MLNQAADPNGSDMAGCRKGPRAGQAGRGLAGLAVQWDLEPDGLAVIGWP